MEIVAVAQLEKRSQPLLKHWRLQQFVIATDRAAIPEKAVINATLIALLPSIVAKEGVQREIKQRNTWNGAEIEKREGNFRLFPPVLNQK